MEEEERKRVVINNAAEEDDDDDSDSPNLISHFRGAAAMAGTLTGELGWGTLFVPGTALFHEY